MVDILRLRIEEVGESCERSDDAALWWRKMDLLVW
jgi:hypothetical protein